MVCIFAKASKSLKYLKTAKSFCVLCHNKKIFTFSILDKARQKAYTNTTLITNGNVRRGDYEKVNNKRANCGYGA